MTSNVFSLTLEEDDWYVLQRLALLRRTTAAALLIDLIRTETERLSLGYGRTINGASNLATRSSSGVALTSTPRTTD